MTEKIKRRYHDESDLKGGVLVYWCGNQYRTGNRRHDEVELCRLGTYEFYRCVKIPSVYSLEDPDPIVDNNGLLELVSDLMVCGFRGSRQSVVNKICRDYLKRWRTHA
jgi:hypothetical protein